MASDARAVIPGEATGGVGGGLVSPRPAGMGAGEPAPHLPPPDGTQPTPSRGRRLVRRLFEPVDISSLVYFRIAFGAILLWEVWRYFNYGWIPRYFITPTFHFTYFGFDWVQPWPGIGMYLHFAALGALALCIMLGLCYRLAAVLFFLAFAYVFLLEQARYLNHFYLVSLVSLLLVFLPAHHAFSLDSRFGEVPRSDWAPTWTLWLLRFQIALPYLYGGIAKLNADWLQGEPMRAWLAQRAGIPVVGPFLTQEWAAYFFSYGGILVDLSIVPLLLWRRTRWIGLAVAVAFNVMNAIIFSIGIFPWFMIAATLLFFAPSWPRRAVIWVEEWIGVAPSRRVSDPGAPPRFAGDRLTTAQRVTVVLLGAWVAFQLLFPLRHHLYPGDVAWNEEGHRFSWRMKLRDKRGSAQFLVTDARGYSWLVNPHEYLTVLQADEMVGRPDMIIQLAHHIADDYRRRGYGPVEVRARVLTSLNGRPRRPLIDPTVDLAGQSRSIWPATWILPLDEPLPPSRV